MEERAKPGRDDERTCVNVPVWQERSGSGWRWRQLSVDSVDLCPQVLLFAKLPCCSHILIVANELYLTTTLNLKK